MGLLFDSIEEIAANFSKNDFSCRDDLVARMDASGMTIRQRVGALKSELAKIKEAFSTKGLSSYEGNVWEAVKKVYTVDSPFMDKRGLRYKISHAPGSHLYDPYWEMDDEEASNAMAKVMEKKRKESHQSLDY